ncbi:MAG: glycosyltransferase family 4 protein [Acidimicrobiales bacterium]
MPEEPGQPTDRLSVAVDATPLLGSSTGVGKFCSGALSGLAARQDLAVGAFAVTWRRRHALGARVPPGVTVLDRAMPARPLHAAWRHGDLPPLEWFIGRQDVVHGSNFVVPPTSSAARVVTVHDLTVLRFPELCEPPTLIFPELIRRALDAGAWVHTPSRFVADEVVAELGADPARVRAVHHGIPPLPAFRSDEALPFDLPEGCRRYVLAVGTVEPRKDYPLLVSAFGEATAIHPDVALVVVGGDGWGVERFRAAVEASPARRRIVRSGYLADRDLAATLRRAEVLAYPSIYEGFGFPPLQAMAAGIPVVATAAGAVPEVVGDGAILVTPGDVDALAGALEDLLAVGSERAALIERGRLVAERFRWDTCADGLADLYRDALEARAGARKRGITGA